MKQATQEWVDKAEADYATAILMRRSRKKFSRDIVCFHLQQCIEKYLKGKLLDSGIAFPKTHDLEKLLDLAVTVEPLWETLRRVFAVMSNHAVATRYPGRTATAAETTHFLKATIRFREMARESLGLN